MSLNTFRFVLQLMARPYRVFQYFRDGVIPVNVLLPVELVFHTVVP